MMIKISNNKLSGTLTAISSKSYAQRAIFIALLTKKTSTIIIKSLSDDIKVALNLVIELGGSIEVNGTKYTIVPPVEFKQNQTLHVGESGTSLRFLIPIIAVLGIGGRIKRSGTLINRPNEIYANLLPKHDVEYMEDGSDIVITGKLKGDKFEVAGNISSQFISGMLIALGIRKSQSHIKLTTELSSKKYVEMTIETMADFGVNVNFKDGEYTLSGQYNECEYIVEGDWSNALFPLVAGVEVVGLNPNSIQADKIALKFIEELGYVNVSQIGYKFELKNSTPKYRILDADQMPDAVPILSILAAKLPGITKVINVERLKIKESDRVFSIISVLRALGVNVEEEKNGFIIKSVDSFTSCAISSFNDHRIAMMLAIAAGFSTGPIIIKGIECVNKSYPQFFDELAKVGAKWQIQ